MSWVGKEGQQLDSTSHRVRIPNVINLLHFGLIFCHNMFWLDNDRSCTASSIDTMIYNEFPAQPNSEMSMMTPSGPLNLASAFRGDWVPRDERCLASWSRGVNRVAPAFSM